MDKLEQKQPPNNIYWKMYDAIAVIEPFQTREMAKVAAKIAIDLAEKVFYQGIGDDSPGTKRRFKQFIQDYE